MIATARHDALMDRVYRHQRHFYDATRKYYLLGRDRLIADLKIPRGGTILEIGCGTGRNLIEIHRRYPDARCFGLDISEVMLETARQNAARANLADALALVQGDATEFTSQDKFGVTHFDRVVMSYCLSMIPDWRAALARAITALAPGGRFLIVDFGSACGLPQAASSVLDWWLGKFHVSRRHELAAELALLASRHDAELSFCEIYGGYAAYARLTR